MRRNKKIIGDDLRPVANTVDVEAPISQIGKMKSLEFSFCDGDVSVCLIFKDWIYDIDNCSELAPQA